MANSNESSSKKKLNALKNRVWITKKTRMIAEERRLRLKLRLDCILNSVSILLLVLSCIGLVPTHFEKLISLTSLSLISVILSIIVTVTSLVITNYNLTDRASAYRDSYLDLASLEAKIDNINENDDADITEKLPSLKRDYTNILKKSLNHTSLDFKAFQKQNNKANNDLPKYDVSPLPSFENFLYFLLYCAFLLILFILSFLVVYIIFYVR